ncbi:hypothetical protein CAAU_0411 [Caloramator australicus RC3]|uniref:Uncharacterized protein n=1 Tax=Caloramator australicus RC3 TaxID=857293 RepID=G0V4M0_9CLOT|nr:hypothetical protein CAAU_0411 [Caloramator australicus RC3]
MGKGIKRRIFLLFVEYIIIKFKNLVYKRILRVLRPKARLWP